MTDALGSAFEHDNASWLAAHRGTFGPNADRVAATLTEAGTTRDYDWDRAEAAASRLASAISRLPGDGGPAAKTASLVAGLRRLAAELDPQMALQLGIAASRFVDDRVRVAAPLQYQKAASDLAEAAVLWPAVFGAHPNPLASVAELLSMFVAPAVDRSEVLLFRGGLARPITVPRPAAPPPTLVVVRDVDL